MLSRCTEIDVRRAVFAQAFDRATYKRLCAALALFFGTESMIVFEARKVKSWAIHALVEAALRESKANG
jgi:hypothetical protein